MQRMNHINTNVYDDLNAMYSRQRQEYDTKVEQERLRREKQLVAERAKARSNVLSLETQLKQTPADSPNRANIEQQLQQANDSLTSLEDQIDQVTDLKAFKKQYIKEQREAQKDERNETIKEAGKQWISDNSGGTGDHNTDNRTAGQQAAGLVKNMANNVNAARGDSKAMAIGASIGRGMSNGLLNTKDPTGMAEGKRASANEMRAAAKDSQAAEQKLKQQGNRDYKAAASEMAVAGSESQNTQRAMQATGGDKGANSQLLNRTVGNLDGKLEQQQQFAAQQYDKGVKQAEEKHLSKEDAINYETGAKSDDYVARDTANTNVATDTVSMGGNVADDTSAVTEEQTAGNETQAQETEATQEQEQQEEQVQEEQPQQPEPQEEQVEEPAESEPTESMPQGNPQHVINGLLGSSKGEDLRQGNGGADQALYDWICQTYGLQGQQQGKYNSPDDRNGETYEGKFIAEFGQPAKEAIQMLRQGRAGDGGDASQNYADSSKMNANVKVNKQADGSYTWEY